MAYKKPELNQLNEMLAMVAGGASSAKPTDSIEASSMSHTGIFIDASGNAVATCSCDLTIGVALGCALSMIPKGGAEAMISEGKLSTMASENLYEVMNIFSSLFMDDRSDHLKLERVEIGVDPQYVADESDKIPFELTIGAYGSGDMVFTILS